MLRGVSKNLKRKERKVKKKKKKYIYAVSYNRLALLLLQIRN